MIYKISNYTVTPGGRYRTDGKFSGEEFREDILRDLFKKVLENDDLLTIDLDNTYGYPSSFLEEAFGGLAREFNSDLVLKYMRFISDDDPIEIERIKKYVKDANK